MRGTRETRPDFFALRAGGPGSRKGRSPGPCSARTGVKMTQTNEISKIEPQRSTEVATTSESASILSMIERATRDQSVDIHKMERLYEMHERVQARAAEQRFNEAMRAAQAEMRPVAANALNKQTSSRYATYDKLDSALRPIYTRHGFSLSFDEADSPKPDHIRVVCYVAHDDGHTRTYRKDMPADGKGAKGGDVMTKTHAAGAAASYGARYLLKGIFNVAIGEDDQDGNAPAGPISAAQLAELRQLIDAFDVDEERFAAFMKTDVLENLPADRFEKAKVALNAHGARNRSVKP